LATTDFEIRVSLTGLKKGRAHEMCRQHFSNSASWRIREIGMNKFAGGETYDEIFTAGLGPCLGIAFAYKGTGYVFHGHGIRQVAVLFDGFLTVARNRIPAADRKSIRPVLAGALISADHDEFAREMCGDDEPLPVDETPQDRSFCVSTLLGNGFGVPHERWCAEQSQCLHLDVKRNLVRVCTESASGLWATEELSAA
jgi:hypothetical protein